MERRRFRQVYLEITNICNLRCSFCPPGRRPGGYLSREDFLRALEQIRPYSRYLYFHVKGEPLLHPLLPEFLELAGDYGFQVTLTTNGVLVPKLAPVLAAAPALRPVNLSLHSYQEGAHGPAPDYVAALAAYARQGAAAGKHTVFRVWTLDGGGEADPASQRMLALLEKEFPGCGSLAARSGQRSVTLAPHVFVSFARQFQWPSLAAPVIPGPGSCYGVRRMIGVLWDGTVVPCCLDGEGECPLGNLLREELADILARPLPEEMAQGFRERRITQQLCRRCGYRTRFGTGDE